MAVILYGQYRHETRRVACRADLCDCCNAVTLTELRQSSVVAHVFFVPLVPLGSDSEWICTSCGGDPTGTRPSSRLILCLGIVACIFLLASSFAFQFSTKFDSIWTFRIGIAAFLAILLYNLIVPKRNAYAEAKRNIPSLSKECCPYCSVSTLLIHDEFICPQCGVEIL